jgi:hypothetical protein
MDGGMRADREPPSDGQGGAPGGDHAAAAVAAALRHERTSVILGELLAAEGDERLTIGEIVAALRNRGLGLMLVVFGAPCMLPAPPPIPFICGVALLAAAANMIAGRTAVWLPPRVARREVPRSALVAVLRRILPATRAIEKFCKPRWFGVSERAGKALFGAVVVLMVAILWLPVPVFGNFTPGLAVTTIGIGLSERDGIVMLVGLALSVVATAFTLTLGWAALQAALWVI